MNKHQLANRKRWVHNAREKQCRYVLVVFDEFTCEEYPVYCKDSSEVDESRPLYHGVDMQEVVEVIDTTSEIYCKL